jgi:hypothetical protein
MKTNTSFTDWISAKSKNPDWDIPLRVFEHIVIVFISTKFPEVLEESEISFTKENSGFQGTGYWSIRC